MAFTKQFGVLGQPLALKHLGKYASPCLSICGTEDEARTAAAAEGSKRPVIIAGTICRVVATVCDRAANGYRLDSFVVGKGFASCRMRPKYSPLYCNDMFLVADSLDLFGRADEDYD
jgi:hypothetical protein